jgi:YfiH family protein
MHDQGSSIPFTSSCCPTSHFFPRVKILPISELIWKDDDLISFRYPTLSAIPELAHGVFARHGGLSDPPYGTLNVSFSVGDRAEHVRGNLARVQGEIGSSRILYLNQLHGKGIHVFRGALSLPSGDQLPGDAMITDVPGVGLMIKQADCQSVVLYDPERRIVANVHCGWRGNVQNILGGVVARLEQDFSCTPSRILAAIGPSLGPCCGEFMDHKKIFPREFEHFMVREHFFDMWAISCGQLIDAGLLPENIELASICTRCRTDLFFSYRGEGVTGRFCTVVMLNGRVPDQTGKTHSA